MQLTARRACSSAQYSKNWKTCSVWRCASKASELHLPTVGSSAVGYCPHVYSFVRADQNAKTPPLNRPDWHNTVMPLLKSPHYGVVEGLAMILTLPVHGVPPCILPLCQSPPRFILVNLVNVCSYPQHRLEIPDSCITICAAYFEMKNSGLPSRMPFVERVIMSSVYTAHGGDVDHRGHYQLLPPSSARWSKHPSNFLSS